jgi:hypothetical protein
MPEPRISSAPSQPLRPTPKAPVAPKPTAPASTRVEADKLLVQGAGQSEAALRIAKEALAFPPKPKKAEEMKPWLMDAYSRLLKAKTAQDTLQYDGSKSSVSVREFNLLSLQISDAENTIAKLDKGGAVKKEFFAAIVPPAEQLIDGLKGYPAPPADKAGKAKWLADAKQELARAKAADDLLNSAWLDFEAIEFKRHSDASSKVHAFESRVRRVEYELNPPAPRSATPGTSSTSPQVFGLTQAATELANSKTAVGQAAGAVALPIAVTIDVIDLISRLNGASR